MLSNRARQGVYWSLLEAGQEVPSGGCAKPFSSAVLPAKPGPEVEVGVRGVRRMGRRVPGGGPPVLDGGGPRPRQMGCGLQAS